jgi:hypothetical protein
MMGLPNPVLQPWELRAIHPDNPDRSACRKAPPLSSPDSYRVARAEPHSSAEVRSPLHTAPPKKPRRKLGQFDSTCSSFMRMAWSRLPSFLFPLSLFILPSFSYSPHPASAISATSAENYDWVVTDFRPDPSPSPWKRNLVPRGRLRLCNDGPSRSSPMDERSNSQGSRNS